MIAPARSHLHVTVFSDAAIERNGVGSYYRDLSAQFRGRDRTMNFISPTRRRNGLYLLSFPLPGDPTQRLRVPHLPGVLRRLQRSRPDVIVISSPGLFGLLGFCLAKWYRIPCCFSVHTDYGRLAGMYWRGALRQVSQGYLDRVQRTLASRSEAVLTVSDELTDHARTHGAPDARRIGSPLPKVFLSRPLRPLPETIDRVLFAGRLAPEKNLPAVIAAARALPDIRFTIAGDGPLSGMVARAARELPNLRAVGWLARPCLLEAIDANALLVLPSHVESFGTVAIEALARQRLVIVSAHCGLLGWKPFAGSVLPMGETETLEAAIERVIALPVAHRQAMVEAGCAAARAINAGTVAEWIETFQVLRARQAEPSRLSSCVWTDAAQRKTA